MTNWLDIIRLKKKAGEKTSTSATETSKPAPVALATPKVRVVFMGTPEFSAVLLGALLDAKYNIVGVVTKEDKKVGRKQEPTPSKVKELALEHNLPVLQPSRFDDEAMEILTSWKPDLIIVAAYGKILPKKVLSLPGFGCVNFHTSLLPKFRGASPVQNALLSGATESGVTIMLMDEGMDTGDILTQKKVSIDPDETHNSLSAKLLEAGKGLLLETIPLWVERQITPTKQDDSQATLCQLIEREDGHINWTDDAESIYNRYRALSPWPGIFSFWKKEDGLLRLKLIRISYQKENPEVTHRFGEIFEVGEKVGVQSGQGIIFLEEVQLEGKMIASIQEFLRGNATLIGSLLQ